MALRVRRPEGHIERPAPIANLRENGPLIDATGTGRLLPSAAASQSGEHDDDDAHCVGADRGGPLEDLLRCHRYLSTISARRAFGRGDALSDFGMRLRGEVPTGGVWESGAVGPHWTLRGPYPYVKSVELRFLRSLSIISDVPFASLTERLFGLSRRR